jgi:hypothetical protein
VNIVGQRFDPARKSAGVVLQLPIGSTLGRLPDVVDADCVRP